MKREWGKDRTELLKIRVHPEEKAIIARMAKTAGLTMSDLLRMAVAELEKSNKPIKEPV